MQSIRLCAAAALISILAGCGGGSSTPVTSNAAAAQVQYAPRRSQLGDERVYQYTDTYSDGSVKTYTHRTVVSVLNPDGSSTVQIFDANNNLLESDVIDSNHILSSKVASSTGFRTCTDGQPRPSFVNPYTVGESAQGSYTVNCLPDGLTALVEKVIVNGTEYTALKGLFTIGATVTYPMSGATKSYSYSELKTEWDDTALGAIVRKDLTRTYTGSAPAVRLVSRSRILVSHINK
jgi:hypothetical protein